MPGWFQKIKERKPRWGILILVIWGLIIPPSCTLFIWGECIHDQILCARIPDVIGKITLLISVSGWLFIFVGAPLLIFLIVRDMRRKN